MILASPHCSNPFANGEMHFVEDRVAPPSRAYLKLWELFTLTGDRPGAGELCLDLGASPVGWSWVLHQLGAHVISVDKASLDPRIAGLPGIKYRQESAFALDPRDVGPVDWLFSDGVCYPKRLFALVRRWLEAGTVRRFVCTIVGAVRRRKPVGSGRVIDRGHLGLRPPQCRGQFIAVVLPVLSGLVASAPCRAL
jgi:23S rRNA (cytidine2498-2'-O)-methyltransferase